MNHQHMLLLQKLSQYGFDTHTHLWDFPPQEQETLLFQARRQGVAWISLAGVWEDDWLITQNYLTHSALPSSFMFLSKTSWQSDMQKVYEGEFTCGLFASLGIHPQETYRNDYVKWLEKIPTIYKNFTSWIWSLGEVGLDYHPKIRTEWETRFPHTSWETFQSRQQECFLWACRFALEHKLPLIIHSREAFADTLKILEACMNFPPPIPIIWHAFSLGSSQYYELLRRGITIAVGGIITNPKARKIKEALLRYGFYGVLETDSPYIPVYESSQTPDIAKPSYPSHIPLIAQSLEELLSSSSQINKQIASSHHSLMQQASLNALQIWLGLRNINPDQRLT